MATQTERKRNRRPKQLTLISGGGLSFDVVSALRELRTTMESVSEDEWRARQARWKGLTDDAEGRIDRG